MTRAPLAMALALAHLAACSGSGPPEPVAPEPEAPVQAWAGTTTCAGCHPDEAAAWTGSHHDLAMQVATPDTVLGAFDGRRAEGGGDEATFERDGDRFLVRTRGADGQEGTFEVAWTFGITPIQQYLVRLDRGAVHALPWLWDTRPAADGGQRWRHLYEPEAVEPGDPLHWAGPQQRWNYMCADCHTTGLHEGYDPAAGTWNTTFFEEDVGCEACHGEGKAHSDWAAAGAEGDDPGLPVDFSKDDGAQWQIDLETGLARRIPERTDHVEVDTCGRCHSRRLSLGDLPPTGASLLDTHRPTALEEGLYFDDGQILDEVFVWGSFVQSRMHAAGVTCTDCHDAHTGVLRAQDDALCAQCHLASRFDTVEHDHHPAGGPGARCRDCHAAERVYMQVDLRTDHSFRVPRPDLSVALGVPEPCTTCHSERDAAWAATTVATWFPQGRAGTAHFAETLHAARTGAPDAHDRLLALLDDGSQPAIVRATAVALALRYADRKVLDALARLAGDPDPLVRREVAEAAASLDPQLRARLVGPLLADPVRGVRIAAALSLVEAYGDTRALVDGEALDAALDEAQASLYLDRPEGLLLLARIEVGRGDPAAAEATLRAALALDPSFTPARVNLADLFRIGQRDAEGVAVLREGLARDDGDAALHHALGLALVRAGDLESARGALARAVALDPEEPRYAYVYAVALASSGDLDGARRVAAEAYAHSPGDRGLLDLLEGYAMQAGDREAVETWRERRARDAPWSVRGR